MYMWLIHIYLAYTHRRLYKYVCTYQGWMRFLERLQEYQHCQSLPNTWASRMSWETISTWIYRQTTKTRNLAIAVNCKWYYLLLTSSNTEILVRRGLLVVDFPSTLAGGELQLPLSDPFKQKTTFVISEVNICWCETDLIQFLCFPGSHHCYQELSDTKKTSHSVCIQCLDWIETNSFVSFMLLFHSPSEFLPFFVLRKWDQHKIDKVCIQNSLQLCMLCVGLS